jgi:hypothetical protein
MRSILKGSCSYPALWGTTESAIIKRQAELLQAQSHLLAELREAIFRQTQSVSTGGENAIHKFEKESSHEGAYISGICHENPLARLGFFLSDSRSFEQKINIFVCVELIYT